MLSRRRSNVLQRSVLRSPNTIQVRGAMRERSNSTKKLLCIVRPIARSVQLNQNGSVYLLQLRAVLSKRLLFLKSRYMFLK